MGARSACEKTDVRAAVFAAGLLAFLVALSAQASAARATMRLFDDDFTAHDISWGPPEPRQLES